MHHQTGIGTLSMHGVTKRGGMHVVMHQRPFPWLSHAGINPLQAYGVGGLTPRISSALGRLVTACHTLYGFSRITSAMK